MRTSKTFVTSHVLTIYQSIKLHWKSFSALSLQTQVWTLKVLLYHRLHQHPLQLYHQLQQDPLNWAAIQTTLQAVDHSYGQLTFPFPPSLMMLNWGSGRAKILSEKMEHFYPFQGTIVISVFDQPWKSKDVWEGVKAFYFFNVCMSQRKSSHFLFVYCTIEPLCGSHQFLFSCADWFLLLYFEEMCLRDTNVCVIENSRREWTFQ